MAATEPVRTEPGRTEPGRPEPGRPEPGRTERGRDRSLAAARWRRMAAAAVTLMAAVSMAAVAPGADAALPSVPGCGFHFGPTSEQGAAGTLYFSVVLEPISVGQHCTVAVALSASVTPLSAAAGPYLTIDHNPLAASVTVSFVPGRLPPTIGVAWAIFHCADPAVPGTLVIRAGGQQTVFGVTPNSCGPPGVRRIRDCHRATDRRLPR